MSVKIISLNWTVVVATAYEDIIYEVESPQEQIATSTMFLQPVSGKFME